MRSRSPSGSGRAAGSTSSRSTSTSGWTTGSGVCWPGWSGSASCTTRTPAGRPSPIVTERGRVGFAPAGRDGPGGVATTEPPIEGAELLDDQIASALLPARDKRGHKGSFGKVLVLAGSLDYAGAALLVCRAAGRAGAGLVTLATPESLQPLFAAKVVEATTMALPEDDVEEIDPEPALARILDHDHDAIVIGPGLRPGLATAELVRLLLNV